MSLYGQFIKERLNKEIIETEKGFVTYYFIDEGCYADDVYVLPEYRRSKESFNLGKQVEDIARQKGCKKLYSSVVPSTPNSTLNLMGLIKFGFRLDSTANNFILVVKDL
jgi:GNAT superfamily N-acetyltransferase